MLGLLGMAGGREREKKEGKEKREQGVGKGEGGGKKRKKRKNTNQYETKPPSPPHTRDPKLTTFPPNQFDPFSFGYL
jgi:hypothetical protein